MTVRPISDTQQSWATLSLNIEACLTSALEQKVASTGINLKEERSMTEESSLNETKRQHVAVDWLLQLTDVSVPVRTVQLLWRHCSSHTFTHEPVVPVTAAVTSSWRHDTQLQFGTVSIVTLVLSCPVSEMLQVFSWEERPHTYSTRILGLFPLD